MYVVAWILTSLFRASVAAAVAFTPMVTDVQVAPGEEAATVFVVENSAEETKEYLVSLYDVTLDSSVESPSFAPLSQEISSWLAVDAYAFSLAPGARRVVTLTVRPPGDAPDGTAVVGLVVRERAEDNGIAITSGVTGLVFITVGDPAVRATVTSLSPSSRFGSRIPSSLRVIIANAGDRVVQPYGVVRITNTFGDTVEAYDVNPSMRRVPPHDERAFTVAMDEHVRGGFFYELWREVVDHRVGIFTATLVVAPYPGADATLSAQTRFVVFPWRSTALLAAVATVVTTIRRKRRW